jgi:hypothetical protein
MSITHEYLFIRDPPLNQKMMEYFFLKLQMNPALGGG